MMSIVTPLWRSAFRTGILFPLLSCIPPAVTWHVTRTVARWSARLPLCLLSALAVPSLLWLWVYGMMVQYVRANLDDELTDIATFYSAVGAGPGSMFWVACAARDAAVEGEGGAAMEVVGTIALERKTPAEAELRRMSVRADHQGRGIAKHLCLVLLEHARRSGFETIFLSTSNGQPGALAMYGRLGWREEAVSPFWGLFTLHRLRCRLDAPLLPAAVR
eukprot:EG_transcript_25103